MIKIVIDDREKPCKIIDTFKQYDDVQLTIKRLPKGDYLIDHKFLFERKTLTDFAISIIDGRLFRQISSLAKSDKRSALILEGSIKTAKLPKISRKAIQGALVTTSLIFGIPILRSKNINETVQIIIYAARQFRANTNGLIKRLGRKPKKISTLQLYLLQGLPGIGPHRAKKLLKAFDNVENVMKADVKKLTQVVNIGNKTAQQIRRIITEKFSDFHTSTNI